MTKLTVEERLERLEMFLSSFCALQLVQQGLIPATKEERDALEFGVASVLEAWKKEL